MLGGACTGQADRGARAIACPFLGSKMFLQQRFAWQSTDQITIILACDLSERGVDVICVPVAAGHLYCIDTFVLPVCLVLLPRVSCRDAAGPELPRAAHRPCSVRCTVLWCSGCSSHGRRGRCQKQTCYRAQESTEPGGAAHLQEEAAAASELHNVLRCREYPCLHAWRWLVGARHLN